MADITPNTDTASPEVDDLLFAQDNSDPWVQFTPSSGSCTVVSGLADILVKARDRDEAGAALGGAGEVWVHDVRWRACPDGTPSCPWQTTRAWDTMPGAWYANNTTAGVTQFSIRTPWISNSSYCGAGWDYAIVTNYVGGMPNAAGAWNTTTIADGSYSVSAEFADLAGRTTVISRLVCVQNTASCSTELTVRDAADDTGAVPYPGPNWWLSPDITANPGTADQDTNINLGAPNPIEVRVWNKGSCSLPAGTSYLELRVRYSGPRATLRSIHLHVPAGLEIGRMVGGDLIGGYRGDRPVDRCELSPEELHRLLCESSEKDDRRDLTRVIGGIDPSGRLLLEGIRVTGKPVRLTLEVRSEEGVRKGEFVEIDVIERGVLPGGNEATPVGGLTMHFDHGKRK